MYHGILRAEHTSNYTIVSNDPRHEDLSSNAFKILMLLLRKPNNWKIIPNAIASGAKLSLYAVKKALRELKNTGFVICENIRDGAGRWSGSFRFVKENPDLPNPPQMDVYSASRNPASGESSGGISTPLIINKESNIQVNNTTSTNYTHMTEQCDEIEVFNTSSSTEDPESESCQDPIIAPLPAKESASTNNSPSEEDLPPQVTIITASYMPDEDLSSVARFDRTIRTYQPTEDLTTQLVETYNKVKPDHWGKCSQIGAHMPRQVAGLLRRYESPELVAQEWGEACLALKANDFYNSPKFQSGNINFLLDPTKPDRIPQLAQAWRDRPQQQKEQLAKKMVAAVDGIPQWENPDVVLEGTNLFFARKRYARWISAGDFTHPECPSREYLKTHFGDLFNV